MSLLSDLARHQRIIPMDGDKAVVSITKNADGSMTFTQANGDTGVIPADAHLIQEFLVYTMLNDQTRKAVAR